jgi:hypothetical protein
MIKFPKQEVIALLSKLTKTDKLTLVGDHGIYLMSFDEKVPEGDKRTIVYAEGCNPEKDEDFYDNKHALYGGDDGGDDIGNAAEMARIVAQAKKYLAIKLMATQIKIGSL